MRRSRSFIAVLALAGLASLLGAANATPPSSIVYDDAQGWTPKVRTDWYRADQGSRLMPMAWLKALHQPDGTPFLADALTRYGFLEDTGPNNPDRLPIGLSVAASPSGPMAGLTCAACHTRDITAAGKTWRLDGAPAFIDFQSFLADVDSAVIRALASDASFAAFAQGALGTAHPEPGATADLHAAVDLWSKRFHTWLGALPERSWGPTRLDAFGMIFNRLGGLDVGAPPSYLIAGNIGKADAPARYPFLWNAPFQDRTDWAGFAANGNDEYALARNLGEVLGVFAIFHPRPTSPGAPLNRDYLGENSSNLPGLAGLEAMLVQLKAPTWPFPVDKALAERGHAVFDKATGEGGCADCHGIKPGAYRGPRPTWKTPVLDVGTDTRMWDTLRRPARTGSMAGAVIPGITEPLRDVDSAGNLLKTAVIGVLAQAKAQRSGPAPKPTPAQQAAMSEALSLSGHAAKPQVAGKQSIPTAAKNQYESRVLKGIWAAAPYLHNGSVPTLADLLKPSAERTRTFAIGPAYDIDTVGLAADQPPSTYVLHATGCDQLDSGDSNCGHEYGTHLPDADKRALLEYLKTL